MLQEDRMGALKRAVRTFLERIPAGSKVAVIAFGAEVDLICPVTGDIDRARAAVESLEAFGSTRFYDAVVEAVELMDGIEGRKAILALTDGEDTSSLTADLESTIRASRRAGFPVHTLGLGNEQEIAVSDLREIAEVSRGQYFSASRPEQLASIYEEIARRLGQTYTLVYKTERTLPDGTLRPVSIFYKQSTKAAAEAEVFIRGMVVPAAGWSRLFLLLAAGLGAAAVAPGWWRRRGAA